MMMKRELDELNDQYVVLPDDRIYTKIMGEQELESQVAILLLADVVFLSSNQNGSVHINCLCNDIFGYACADAEEVLYSEINDLFEHYMKDEFDGPIIWCIKKRKVMPIQPVAEAIQKSKIWDLSKLQKDFDLVDNPF